MKILGCPEELYRPIVQTNGVSDLSSDATVYMLDNKACSYGAQFERKEAYDIDPALRVLPWAWRL
jgi:hypothetical protein